MYYHYPKPAAIARRLAIQYWGPVQRQRKLADGIWWFSTEGHGGFVVDINVRPELAEFRSDVFYRDRLYEREQHFAVFEEDCMAAIVEWTYPEIMASIQKTLIEPMRSKSFEEFKRERIRDLRDSLIRWNPNWLDRYPEPGIPAGG